MVRGAAIPPTTLTLYYKKGSISMSIYKKRTPSRIYRKIYEQYHGPIPKDENNRTYDIHHIDGDSENNDPSNLVALSLKDHYNLHYSQGDYMAAWLLGGKLKVPTEELSDLAKKSGTERIRKIYRWKNLTTGTIEELSVSDFIKKYNFHTSQGNISQMINGKFQTAKGWTIWFL